MMYLETIQYHKNNNVTELEIDKDISTIIGILSEDEIKLLSEQALCTLLHSYNRIGGEIDTFESYVQKDEKVMREEVTRANKELNSFRNYKGQEMSLDISNLCKNDIKNLKYEQRQIILYKFYWNTKNNQRCTYGNDNKCMGEEIDKIVRDSVLKRASIRSKNKKCKMNSQLENVMVRKLVIVEPMALQPLSLVTVPPTARSIKLI